MSAPAVELERIGPGGRKLVERMLDACLTELAALDGAPAPPYPWLPLYWREKGRLPYFIRARRRCAGFVFVNERTRLPGSERAVAELFVLPHHRRVGAGGAAVRKLFAELPGVWEVAVRKNNPVALAFWRRTLGALGALEHDAVSEIVFQVTTPAFSSRIAAPSAS